ncbi:MAG: hypothetical protein HWE30_13160 [Methylocystaceae bacterium]|nr:hypothetical protein [Methylocystaceae bacterium]
MIGLCVSFNAYAQEADTSPPVLTDADIIANTNGFSAPTSDAERAVDAILTYDTLASSDRRFGDLMDYMVGYPNRKTNFDHLYDQFFTPALTKAWRTAERNQVQKNCNGQYIEGEQCGLGFNPLTCAQDDPAQGYLYRTERKSKGVATVTTTWQGQLKPLAAYSVVKQDKAWVIDGVSCLNDAQFN